MEVEVQRENIRKQRKAQLDSEREDDEAVVRTEAQNPMLLSSIYNYLVVLSIILIIFAAFRNSVTWWVISVKIVARSMISVSLLRCEYLGEYHLVERKNIVSCEIFFSFLTSLICLQNKINTFAFARDLVTSSTVNPISLLVTLHTQLFARVNDRRIIAENK